MFSPKKKFLSYLLSILILSTLAIPAVASSDTDELTDTIVNADYDLTENAGEK